MRLYNDHFHHVDPFALSPVARTAVAGVCATDETFIPRADLIRSEYYNDFAVRFDNTRLMSVLLEKEGSVASALTILRGRRNQQFDARDQRFLRALSPHVRRALQIHRRLYVAEFDRSAAMDTVDALQYALFMVDGESHVVLANRRGNALLAARDGLWTDGGRLCAPSPGDTKKLRDLLRQGGRYERGRSALLRRGACNRRPFVRQAAVAGARHADHVSCAAGIQRRSDRGAGLCQRPV